MADFPTVFGSLRTRLESNFAALPLYWPNDDREPSLDDCPNGFVLSELRVVDEGAVSLGKDGERWHSDTGELAIYVYVPRGTLAGTAEAHAKTIRDLFKMSAVDDVTVTRRVIGAGATVDGGGSKWWAVPIIISWFSDRIE